MWLMRVLIYGNGEMDSNFFLEIGIARLPPPAPTHPHPQIYIAESCSYMQLDIPSCLGYKTTMHRSMFWPIDTVF